MQEVQVSLYFLCLSRLLAYEGARRIVYLKSRHRKTRMIIAAGHEDCWKASPKTRFNHFPPLLACSVYALSCAAFGFCHVTLDGWWWQAKSWLRRWWPTADSPWAEVAGSQHGQSAFSRGSCANKAPAPDSWWKETAQSVLIAIQAAQPVFVHCLFPLVTHISPW